MSEFRGRRSHLPSPPRLICLPLLRIILPTVDNCNSKSCHRLLSSLHSMSQVPYQSNRTSKILSSPYKPTQTVKMPHGRDITTFPSENDAYIFYAPYYDLVPTFPGVRCIAGNSYRVAQDETIYQIYIAERVSPTNPTNIMWTNMASCPSGDEGRPIFITPVVFSGF